MGEIHCRDSFFAFDGNNFVCKGEPLKVDFSHEKLRLRKWETTNDGDVALQILLFFLLTGIILPLRRKTKELIGA